MGNYIGRSDIGTGLKIEDDKVLIDFVPESGLDLLGNSLTLDIVKLQGLLSTGSISIVSTDAGNILQVGSDNGAILSADTIKDVVGSMVSDATDGIDYDALAKVLTTKIKSLAVTDSGTIDFTIVNNDGDENITGEVKVSTATTSALKVTDSGLYVPKSQPVNGSTVFSTIPADVVENALSDALFAGIPLSGVTFIPQVISHSFNTVEATLSIAILVKLNVPIDIDVVAEAGFQCKVDPQVIASFMGRYWDGFIKQKFDIGSNYWFNSATPEDQVMQMNPVVQTSKNEVSIMARDVVPAAGVADVDMLMFTFNTTVIRST